MKSLLTVTNLAYVIAAIYFIAVSALGEATAYSISAAILCLVSVPLSLKKDWFFSVPFRVATAAFAIILFMGQLVASSTSVLSAFLINGVLLVIFLGVFLSAIRDSMKKESKEEKEEEEKEEELDKKKREAKKLTYEV